MLFRPLVEVDRSAKPKTGHLIQQPPPKVWSSKVEVGGVDSCFCFSCLSIDIDYVTSKLCVKHLCTKVIQTPSGKNLGIVSSTVVTGCKVSCCLQTQERKQVYMKKSRNQDKDQTERKSVLGVKSSLPCRAKHFFLVIRLQEMCKWPLQFFVLPQKNSWHTPPPHDWPASPISEYSDSLASTLAVQLWSYLRISCHRLNSMHNLCHFVGLFFSDGTLGYTLAPYQGTHSTKRNPAWIFDLRNFCFLRILMKPKTCWTEWRPRVCGLNLRSLLGE